MKAGNLSAAFTENTEAEARAAALAWIEAEAEALIETWTLLGLWQPRADRPLFWRAEFDVTYRPRLPGRRRASDSAGLPGGTSDSGDGIATPTERLVPALRRNALPSPLGRPAPSLAGRPSFPTRT